MPKRAATTAAVLGLGIICAIISSGINIYIYTLLIKLVKPPMKKFNLSIFIDLKKAFDTVNF